MNTLENVLKTISAIEPYMPMVVKLMPEFGSLVQQLIDGVTDSDIVAMQQDDNDAAADQQRAINEAKARETGK
jgi:hypothetical protein